MRKLKKLFVVAGILMVSIFIVSSTAVARVELTGIAFQNQGIQTADASEIAQVAFVCQHVTVDQLAIHQNQTIVAKSIVQNVAIQNQSKSKENLIGENLISAGINEQYAGTSVNVNNKGNYNADIEAIVTNSRNRNINEVNCGVKNQNCLYRDFISGQNRNKGSFVIFFGFC